MLWRVSAKYPCYCSLQLHHSVHLADLNPAQNKQCFRFPTHRRFRSFAMPNAVPPLRGIRFRSTSLCLARGSYQSGIIASRTDVLDYTRRMVNHWQDHNYDARLNDHQSASSKGNLTPVNYKDDYPGRATGLGTNVEEKVPNRSRRCHCHTKCTFPMSTSLK